MSSEETGDSSEITKTKIQSPISEEVSQKAPYSSIISGKSGPESLTQTTTATGEETNPDSEQDDKKPAARNRDQTSDVTSPSTPDDPRLRPRQVIAVSASKGPAAFFNLARKFLITDELCDLSALEGAIVSAADAAHLLERSKLATIVRVQTSYVSVEPKRKRQIPSPQPVQEALPPSSQEATVTEAVTDAFSNMDTTFPARVVPPQNASRELRRARIIITVKRTENYKRWLEENPLQAIIAGDDEDDDDHSVQILEASSQLS